MPHKVTIYTDGACSGNPGPGGYGIVLISGSHRKELSAGYRLTTNNRMELMAAITALEVLKKPGTEVVLHTDSQYLANAVNNGWVFNWEKKRFAKKKNTDLWIRFLDMYRKHKVKLVWVRGHSANKENERCDFLAVEAARGSVLNDDKGYQGNNDNDELL